MIIAHQTHLAILAGRCTWSPGSQMSEHTQHCWHTGWASTAPRHRLVHCRVSRTGMWNLLCHPHMYRDSGRGWTHTRLCSPDTDYLWGIWRNIKFTSTCSSLNRPAGGDMAQIFSSVKGRHFNPLVLNGIQQDPWGRFVFMKYTVWFCEVSWRTISYFITSKEQASSCMCEQGETILYNKFSCFSMKSNQTK